MRALREEFPVEDDLMQLEPRVAKIENEVTQLNSRVAGVEVVAAKLESRLEVLTTRWFTLWVAVISAAATIAAAVLAIIFGSPHGH